jgi:hypothetical protein
VTHSSSEATASGATVCVSRHAADNVVVLATADLVVLVVAADVVLASGAAVGRRRRPADEHPGEATMVTTRSRKAPTRLVRTCGRPQVVTLPIIRRQGRIFRTGARFVT